MSTMHEFNPQRTTLRDWCANYAKHHDLRNSTQRTHRSVVASFGRWLVLEPTIADAAEKGSDFIEWVSDKKSRHTAASYRRVLNALLRYATNEGVVPKFNLRQVRVPDIMPRAFSHQELTKLLAACNLHPHGKVLAAAIRLAYDTGLRRGDLFTVRWSDLSNDRVLRLIVSKTGRRESRVIRQETLDALRQMVPGDDGCILTWPYNWSSWAKAWKKLVKLARIHVKEPGVQMIRRSAASYLKLAGGNPSDILGHSAKSEGLADRYYIDRAIVDRPPPLPPEITS